MDKKKIKKEYFSKITLLETYNKSYYDKSNPIVTDETYDKLKKTIFLLEKEHFF
jgi:NAD-dependent DNA ligase